MQAQRIQQPLGRGVVAVQNGDAITLTWRKLAQEPENVEYNVYCRASGGSYTKVNSSPLSQTNLQTTTSRVPVGSEVAVALVVNGVEGALSEPFLLKSHSVRGVFVDLSYDGFLNNAGYTTKFIWPADLTGDGEYDYVVDRLSTVDGVSDKVEAYTRDGKRLWTIDMGPNIRICQGHNDMVLAYDMNCDGKAEVVIKSSDGTRFWNSEANGWGAYLKNATNGDTDGDGIIDYSAQSVKNPPQYITVVDGLTGKEKSTVEMTYPSYSGNTYTRTNKSSYMDEEYSKLNGHMAVAYLDGVHPSVSMEYMVRTSDKNHHYYVSAWGYDFSTGEAGEWKEKFTWVRNNKSPWPAEFHHIRVADVNMDGHDEILDGGFAVAHTGNMLFSAGISHGDRFRVGDIDPDRPGLETFAIQQNAGDMLGQILYDAGTGEPIKKWYLSAVGDVGRGECIDVDPAHKGYEMWSTMGNLYNAKGDLISTASVPFPREGMWWDGELDREILAAPDGNGYNAMITKYNGSRLIEMARLSGWTAVAEYGTRPAFFGDIIGDWREEVILRKVESSVCTGIMGFSTDFSTNVSLYCFQQNPAYRMQCTTRGYYQSPYPDYYLGYDMSTPPLPACMVTDLVWSNGSSWQQGGSGFTDFSRGKSAAYSDGKSVLFDISGSDVSAIELSGNLAPSVVYAMVPKGKEYVWSGSGSLSGEMEMWKSMNGRLVVNVPLQYSGVTHISEGTLELNGPIAGPLDLRAKGTLAGNAVLNGKVQFEDALNYEGARIQPGTPELPFGVITFNKDLLIDKQIYVELDLQNGENAQCDMLQINGNLTLASPFFIRFITGDSKPAAGEYSLMEWSGDLVGDISQISVKGLSGLAYSLEVVGKSLQLHIRGQRDASDGVAWMGYESGEWNYQLANFTLADEATEFVAGDVVRFDDEALQTSVTVNELIPTGGVVFDHSTNYTLTGEGGLSGSGGLTKRGSGKLTLASTKSDYTGVTRIEEGTVEVRELSDGGIASSFGASDAKSGNFVMGKAVLLVNNVNAATNRPLTLNDTAVVRVPSGVTSLKGIITGSGTLVKEGAGQLNITYGGANSYSGGTILKAGILAMGAWNTTFGQTGKKLYAEGGTIRIFNNNSTSAVPSFNYQLEVPSGKSVNLEAGDRCTIGGSMLGGGTVKLSIPYVRAEFLSTMTNFSGSLQVSGNQVRLCQSTDMCQTALGLNDGVYMAHLNQGSGNEKSGCTTRVGALTSSVKIGRAHV